MEERIDLIVSEEKKTGGISLAVIISLVLHVALVILFVRLVRPAAAVQQNTPIMRYVELMRQNPQDRTFHEAPGPAIDRTPLNAPLSDKNRKASIPQPTGDQPTTRPGERNGAYTPPMPPPGRRPAQPQAQQQQPQSTAAQSTEPAPQDDGRFAFRESQQPQQTSATGAATNGVVDWRSAIREVGKVASLNGGDGLDLGNIGGGEKGFAEQGPLSFETQWYDWGEYAQSMVSRIRVNWYANMPQIIRTGMKGVVTIRFTIMRDGRIVNVQILEGSSIPPYDYAAKKAIDLSSPLNPLPKDFPNASERVTAMFFYNMEPPQR
ncbi:MAG TPA: energy transducer TonB [Thermoanaerobaculia bacterium]|nr:energy transducer TonB [Thermoanaerobaculia bacterium]